MPVAAKGSISVGVVAAGSVDGSAVCAAAGAFARAVRIAVINRIDAVAVASLVHPRAWDCQTSIRHVFLVT